MDPHQSADRAETARRLFDELAERTPEERAERLQAVDDASLRREVTSLLDAFDRPDDKIEALDELHALLARPGAAADPHQLVDQRVRQYEITEHLGAGGMGVVYKAHDTRLGRTVALKFLPPHLAASEEAQERFAREAKAASALDHPHIATVYEIGRTEEGHRFIAMAYYEGATLKEMLRREGPLPVEEALSYAEQIAEALAEAHAAGIVHRDVKPANVMVTHRGEVKLLDFGLARAGDQSQLTRAGARMGTATYMSPEQARGDEVDPRTDLWALGVVLYEMLTGVRPFRGERETAVLHSILHEEPPPLTEHRDGVPSMLQTIVERCLRKAPDRRYAETEAFLADLNAVRGMPTSSRAWRRRVMSTLRPSRAQVVRYGAMALLVLVALAAGVFWYTGPGNAPAPVKTLAVLPFSDLSPNEQNRAFADGVTEDVLTTRGQIEDLRVIGRTSVLPYRDTDKSLPEIADELGVGYLLEGSVRRAGDQVRITTRLVDGTEGGVLWRARYDRQLEDIFAVQTDIAKAIADALETELAPDVEERIERAPTDNLAAYQLFLRGREYVRRGTKTDNETGIDLLRQALERDPDFALARATLAKGYAQDAWALGGNAQWADSAIVEAERAVALAPDLAEAHTSLGRAHMAAGRFGEATASFERALELNPNDWGAANSLGIVYLQTGHLAPAIQQWKRVLKGNPASAHGLRFNLALAYRVLGLLDRAEQENHTALALKPEHVLATVNQAHVDLFQADTAAVRDAAERLVSNYGKNPYALQSAGWLYIFIGATKRARAPLERAHAVSPTASGEGYVRVRLGYVLWRADGQERATQLFEDFDRFASEQLEKGNEYPMLPYSLAAAHAVRGETEQAFQWLERAVEAGWPYELTTVHDPLLAPLRDDKRFRTLVDRMRARNAEMRRQLAEAERRARALGRSVDLP